jgi:hypothetical protein
MSHKLLLIGVYIFIFTFLIITYLIFTADEYKYMFDLIRKHVN